MIVLTTTGKLYSTLYAWDGSKEIRSLLKAMRLDRSALKDEGHPTDEHIVVPVNKMETARNRSTPVDWRQFRDIQEAKAAQRIVKVVSDTIVKTLTDGGPDRDDFINYRAGSGRKRKPSFHRSREEDTCI